MKIEKAQFVTGNGAGLNFVTLTPHDIVFGTYSDEAGATRSMRILGTGTREVQILAPLQCSGSLSKCDNAVTSGGNWWYADRWNHKYNY